MAHIVFLYKAVSVKNQSPTTTDCRLYSINSWSYYTNSRHTVPILAVLYKFSTVLYQFSTILYQQQFYGLITGV